MIRAPKHPTRIQTNFRFTPLFKLHLSQMSRRLGKSQTQIIEEAVKFYRHEATMRDLLGINESQK